MSDTIADLLTRIRNACHAEHRFLDVRWSKMKESIVNILKSEGFISDFKVEDKEGMPNMRVFLKYTPERKPIIQGLKRVSRPGRRRYVGAEQVPSVYGGIGISIISTSKGVIPGKKARKERVGGEVLCYVW